MDVREFLRVLRLRWILVAAVTLLCLGATLAVTLTTPKQYRSSTELFVSTQSTSDVTQLLQGTDFTQQQVQSYARVVTSPAVLQPVIDQLGLEMTPAQLAGSVSAVAPLNTVLIDVVVHSSSPVLAARIAQAVGKQFSLTIVSLDQPAAGGVSPVRVTMVQQARVPAAPASPDVVTNLVLGLLVGLLLGIGAAALRQALDTSVKDEEEVAAVTDAPVLGHIAFDEAAAASPLLIQADPHGPRAEAFRALRTNLQFVGIGGRPPSTVITSSVPAEGKSTTTANLALTLAAAGATVAIVEADLRRPRIAQYFGLEDAAGLTDVLIGRATLDDVLQPWGEDGKLAILACGPLPPNPSELLGSDAMGSVLDTLVTRFDHVLVDAPPLLPFTDAAVLSRITGGTLMVVGSKRVDRDGLRRALSTLARVDTALLGIVLNLVPARATSRYGYGYGYGYGEDTRDDGRGRRPGTSGRRRRGASATPPVPAVLRAPAPITPLLQRSVGSPAGQPSAGADHGGAHRGDAPDPTPLQVRRPGPRSREPVVNSLSLPPPQPVHGR